MHWPTAIVCDHFSLDDFSHKQSLTVK